MKTVLLSILLILTGSWAQAQLPVFNNIYNTTDTLNSNNADFFGEAIEVEGGYLTVGYHNAWSVDTTMLTYIPTVYHLDHFGNIIDNFEFNIGTSYRVFGFKLLKIDENNFLLGGRYDHLNNDGSIEGSIDLLAKFNLNGELDWWQLHGDTLGLGPYGADSNGINSKLIKSFDSGYLYGGQKVYLDNNYLSNVRYVKIDTLGNIDWEREIFTDHDEKCIDMVANKTDSTYTMLVAKMIEPEQYEYFTELVLVKINEQGQILREDTIKSFTDNNALNAFIENVTSLFLDKNNNYLITGNTGQIPFITKVSPIYETIWEYNIQDEIGTKRIMDLVQDTDGNYIGVAFLGASTYDEITPNVIGNIVKLNQHTGDTIWTRILTHFGLESEVQSYPSKIKTTSDGGFLISGYQFGVPETGSDAWLVKTDENGCIDTTGCWVPDPIIGIEAFQNPAFHYTISPNPAKTNIIINGLVEKEIYNYQIVNSIGAICQSGELNSSKINVSKLSAGIYFISIINSQNQRANQRFIVE